MARLGIDGENVIVVSSDIKRLAHLQWGHFQGAELAVDRRAQVYCPGRLEFGGVRSADLCQRAEAAAACVIAPVFPFMTIADHFGAGVVAGGISV